MVREFLWRECGLCGTKDTQLLRETICSFVRHHMLPVRLVDQSNPEYLARRIAAIGELLPAFTWNELSLLGEADVRGRIADDTDKCIEKVELGRLLAEEAGCFFGPYTFFDAHVRRAYLAGRNVQPDHPLYDEAWGEVVIMCGLPGTGKGTWISQHLPNLPMVSLDGIRRELRVDPADGQGRVVHEALD